MKPRLSLQAVIGSGDESGFVAKYVNLPVITQGATIEASLSNLRKAVGLMLDNEYLKTWPLTPNPTIMVAIPLEPDYA